MTQVKDKPLRQRGSSRDDDDGQQRRLTRHHVSNLRPIASRGGGEETYKKKNKNKKDNAGAALRSAGKHTKCAPTGGGGILAASPLLIVCHLSEIKSNSFVFRMPDTFLRDIFFSFSFFLLCLSLSFYDPPFFSLVWATPRENFINFKLQRIKWSRKERRPIQLVELGLTDGPINCSGRSERWKLKIFSHVSCTRVQDPKKGFLCQPKRDKCIKSCQQQQQR